MPRAKRTWVRLATWSDEDLAEGRRLVEGLTRTQFALGDLGLRVAGPAAARGARNGSYAPLARFAEEIGISGDSMRQYRFVAGAWPVEERIEGASWSLHRALANEANRHDLLADFIAAARRGEFRPTRTKLLSWLRERNQTDPGSSQDDPWLARKSIVGWADECSCWINRHTKEEYPWTLARRRSWALLLAVDASLLFDEDSSLVIRSKQVMLFDEQLMTDILSVADVLPRMRLAFGTWVARMHGGELADEVIDPGALPDSEALQVLWEAMLNWAATPDGQRGWEMVVTALGHRMEDDWDKLMAETKNQPVDGVIPLSPKTVHECVRSAMRFSFATFLTGREDLAQAGRLMVESITELAEKLQGPQP